MRRTLSVLLLVASAHATAAPGRILIVGDILLSRLVAREIEHRSASPWGDFEEFFQPADLLIGNLEGAVGSPEQCVSEPQRLCFAVGEKHLHLLPKAGFNALISENNHADDLGDVGRIQTRKALTTQNLKAVDFENSPAFFRVGDKILALVALNRVPGKHSRIQYPDAPETRRKITLARKLAHWVAVSIHWGDELTDWPNTAQFDEAQILIEQGVDLIVGHHPHVVQAPHCLDAKPVFFSLGNHLFDQKYPATHTGLIAECTANSGQLTCRGVPTRKRPGSTFPVLANTPAEKNAPLMACPVSSGTPLEFDGITLQGSPSDKGVRLEAHRAGRLLWRTPPMPIDSLEAIKLTPDTSERALLAIERRYSTLDWENAPRPRVYRVTENGLVALWRGSALAWPLLSAEVMPHGGEDLLCALHRGDSFLVPEVDKEQRRTLAYRWNGFGFSATDEPSALESCRLRHLTPTAQ